MYLVAVIHILFLFYKAFEFIFWKGVFSVFWKLWSVSTALIKTFFYLVQSSGNMSWCFFESGLKSMHGYFINQIKLNRKIVIFKWFGNICTENFPLNIWRIIKEVGPGGGNRRSSGYDVRDAKAMASLEFILFVFAWHYVWYVHKTINLSNLLINKYKWKRN